jgi:hypothetical protein
VDSQKARIQASTIVSFSALALSFCGVIVSVFQTRIMIQQQRAMVWPHLQFGTANLDGYALMITNAGLGPAIIRSVDVSVGSEHYETFAAFADTLKKNARDKGADLRELATINSYLTRRTLRAGEEAKVLWFKGPKPATEHLEHAAEAMDFRIVYSSIHEQCWELTRSDTRVLDSCP